jgi:hypothetical protein
MRIIFNLLVQIDVLLAMRTACARRAWYPGSDDVCPLAPQAARYHNKIRTV